MFLVNFVEMRLQVLCHICKYIYTQHTHTYIYNIFVIFLCPYVDDLLRCVSEDLFQFELIPDIGEPKILSVGTSSGKLCTGFITDSRYLLGYIQLIQFAAEVSCGFHCQ